jgi:hypothetical protein
MKAHARGFPVVKRLDLSSSIVDFEQSKHDVHQGHQPETQRCVGASCDLPRGTQQPSGIEMLGSQTCDRNTSIFEPHHHCLVKRLIARRVGDRRRQSRLQPLLQRPDYGDDEEGERQRRKDTAP